MFSAILPWCMSVTVLILTIICLEAGHDTTSLQVHPVITIDTHVLKSTYEKQYGPTPAIPGAYKIFMQTYCWADAPWWAASSDNYCTSPSSYSRFEPATQIEHALQGNSSNPANTTLPFFPKVQNKFKKTFDRQLHVAYVFYVMAAVETSIAIVLGLVAFANGKAGYIAAPFSACASTSLIIACAIVTAVANQARDFITDANSTVTVSVGRSFLGLTWSAFVISSVGGIFWKLRGDIARGHY